VVIQLVNLVPQGLQVKNLTRQGIGPHHIGCCCRPGFGSNEIDKGCAGAIDHRVGHEGGDDFALERVVGHRLSKFFVQHLGK
jgi:hypothetical protein